MGQTITFDNATARISANASLKELNLKIATGEHWTIIGASGSTFKS